MFVLVLSPPLLISQFEFSSQLIMDGLCTCIVYECARNVRVKLNEFIFRNHVGVLHTPKEGARVTHVIIPQFEIGRFT